jgi:hypothetical protein
MRLTSSAFKENGIIPSRYTCEGDDMSPPLHISEVPKNAKSLVLIMEDPDVPKSIRTDGMWDHLILFNILPNVQTIAENTTPLCKSGTTTSGHTSYEGPCPPDREHRYFFKLYALDMMLNLLSGCTKALLKKAMDGHILSECELMGRYEKGKGH